ncbi:hypothetical protein Tco_1476917 [Tanacetum coccineum]
MEEIKEKAAQELKLLALSKPKLIKVVHEEATKAKVDPKAHSSKKGDVFGDETFQRMSDIHKVDVDTLLSYLVMASNIGTSANKRLCTVMRSMIESHPDKEKLKLKKVKLEAIGYSLN